MSMREKDQADFELERFIEMFDEAMTSTDPRVVDALRSLMMIVTLTRPEARNVMTDRNHGPLRRLREDVRDLSRRLMDLEGEFRNRHYREQATGYEDPYEKFSMKAQNQIAAQIDRDVMRLAGLTQQVPPKGLINK
jgi:hypothetical protein